MVTLYAPFAGWLSTLDEVADPVFATRMMGDGVAIDPVEPLLRAPADAEVIGVAPTGHSVTLRLPNGAELLIHLGLDTVTLGGRGFDPHVSVGDHVRKGDPLLAFDMELLAREARDLVTPLLLPGDGVRVVVDRPGRLVAAGDPIAQVETVESITATVEGGAVAERSLTVSSPAGLHARPAARIVALLKSYAADVTLRRDGREASTRSPIAMLSLGARLGDTLTAIASGPDAEAALAALAAFAEERFGDPPGEAEAAITPMRTGPIRAAPGLAIGRIRQFRMEPIPVEKTSQGAAHETAVLDRARQVVIAKLGSDAIAEAHRAILDDPALHAEAHQAIAAGASAGVAWTQAITQASASLVATGDARLAERIADLQDLEQQVHAALAGVEASIAPIPPDTILIAEDLLPSQFLALDRTRLAGICTAAGGPTAHVAILAAAAGVPMLVSAGRDVLGLADEVTAILDADAGTLTIDPDPEALAAVAARRAMLADAADRARHAAQDPAITTDGTAIHVFANLGSVADAAAAIAAGAEGCGLLRTEFLFLDRETAPDETEQRDLYGRIAATLGNRPMIIRTLDIGGDKPVPYLPLQPEENPALGLRGLRLSLLRTDLFTAQLRAILAAVPGRQCRILLPMVIDRAEIAAARSLIDEAAAAVGRTEPYELGVMIETPAAALLADQLAHDVDFLSIGTNDLTQYALAADRGNAGVAAKVDALHPAMLRLIHMTAEGASRHGRWVGLCGGLASDPAAAALLVGLGIRELSVVPSAVGTVKAAIRATSLDAARRLAGEALAATSPAAVRDLLGERS